MFRGMCFSLLLMTCFSVTPVKAAEGVVNLLGQCGLYPPTTQCVAEGANTCARLVSPKFPLINSVIFCTYGGTFLCCAICGEECQRCYREYREYRRDQLLKKLMPGVLSMTGRIVWRKKNKDS